jgi:voltage-gated potassium channel
MIIAHAGAVIVEAVAGGVVTGALAERRRERAIDQLHDHFIICGSGRVGRHGAEEFRAADVPSLVDPTPESDTPIAVGDVLIGVGSPDEIQAREDLFTPRETVGG